MNVKERLKNINYSFLGAAIVAWTLCMMQVSSRIGGNNLIYAIGEIQAYNKNLFVGNMYLGKGVISPRYVIDALFDVMMHLNGGNWAGADLLWIYFGVFIGAIAIANISYRISKKNPMILSALFSCLIMYCGNYLAGFHLYEFESTSIGVGIGFSILSISFLIGEQRNYNFAWVFAACAVICHIHEGIYCCCVIFLFAIIDSFIKKKLLIKENIMIVVAVLSLVIIILPSIFTDHADISDSEFVYIYSIFRHPHHLVPSTWGFDSILNTIWADIGMFAVCLVERSFSKTDSIRQRLYEAIALVCAWISAFSIMYLFTEVKPIAFVSTLFLSKSFKYVLLVALIWMLKAIVKLRDRGLYISSYLLIYYAFMIGTYELKFIFLITVFVILVMVVEHSYLQSGKMLLRESALPLVDVCVFAFMMCIKYEVVGILRGLIVALVFFAIYVISLLKIKRVKVSMPISVLATICILLISLPGRLLISEGGSVSLISGEAALKSTMGEDLYLLAQDFKNVTNDNEEYLANPDDTTNVGWFQIVSERNCYVLKKVIPSSKATVDDWYDRYMKTIAFDEKTGEDIAVIMREAAIKYLLVNEENYSKFDNDSDYAVFLSSPSDSFRIYQLY